ncbi:hypothetical protein C8Q80DRAFT_1198197 [Daedaleopsis nitida]|nr:hypothetical protein C8Q80DRAFT_1198197 [Daedaleopsis nitida]
MGVQDVEASYDINFCFPIRELENDRVKLTPFIPSVHGDAFWAGTRDTPEVYTYLPFGPRPPLAGLTGFLNADRDNLSLEVGMLICLPACQRRQLTYSAVSLLLQYCLELPGARGGGLGLRRVQYQTDAGNVRSLALARKLGFQLECVQRWQRVLAGDKIGNGVAERQRDPLPGTKGRDTAILSVCWDDWEREVKEKICVPGMTMYAPP